MGNIQTFLEKIRNARYGKEVRGAIADGIEQCYADGHAGSIDLEARQRLDDVETRLNSDKTVKYTSKAFENITIAAGTAYTFSIPVPSGDTGTLPLFARSSDTTRSLVAINMYTYQGAFNVIMRNESSAAMTNINPTIQVTYACDV